MPKTRVSQKQDRGSIFEQLLTWAEGLRLESERTVELQDFILSIERVLQDLDSPPLQGECENRLQELLTAAVAAGSFEGQKSIRPQVVNAMRAYMHSMLIELIVPWHPGDPGIFTGNPDRFGFGSRQAERAIVVRKSASPWDRLVVPSGSSPNATTEIDEDSALAYLVKRSGGPRRYDLSPSEAFILTEAKHSTADPLPENAIKIGISTELLNAFEDVVKANRQNPLSVFLHPRNVAWPIKLELASLHEAIVLSSDTALHLITESEYGRIQLLRYSGRSGSYPVGGIPSDISSELKKESARNGIETTLNIQVVTLSSSPQSIGKLIWSLGAALALIPGVEIELDDVRSGSFFANIRITMKTLWHRDQVEQILLDARSETERLILEGAQAKPDTGEIVRAQQGLADELARLSDIILGNDNQSPLRDESKSEELRERYLESMVVSKELDNKIKQMEAFTLASGIISSGLLAADPVKISLEGLGFLALEGDGFASGCEFEDVHKVQEMHLLPFQRDSRLAISVARLDIPKQAAELLMNNKITTVGHLINVRKDEIRSIEGIGRGSMRRIVAALERLGLELANEERPPVASAD